MLYSSILLILSRKKEFWNILNQFGIRIQGEILNDFRPVLYDCVAGDLEDVRDDE